MLRVENFSQYFHILFKDISIIPVVVIDDVTIAKELAKLLVNIGLPVIEVTLRTPRALAVIEEMSTVEGATVGAGTVLNERDVNDCKAVGAKFAVSPGFTQSLIDACAKTQLPLLPGVATVSEVMHLAEKGFNFLKFFPAEDSGGVSILKHFYSPLPHICFCPTGGVNLSNINAYLSLPNVPVVGGTWLISKEDLDNRNWQSIVEKTALLKTASANEMVESKKIS